MTDTRWNNNKRVFIDNTKFIFDTNFSGDPARDNFGDASRKGNIIVPTYEQAMELRDRGLNVRETKNRHDEEDFEPTYFVTIKLGYRNRFGEKAKYPPKVYLVSGDSEPVLLDEESVGETIDQISVANVDAVLNIYENKDGNKTLWVNAMYVTQNLDNDPYYSKYHGRSRVDEEVPF